MGNMSLHSRSCDIVVMGSNSALTVVLRVVFHVPYYNIRVLTKILFATQPASTNSDFLECLFKAMLIIYLALSS